MHIRSAVTLLVCSASLVLAQNQAKEKLCNPASATTVVRDNGVIVQNVVLNGKWGSNEATVYLPDKETADGAVLFSSLYDPFGWRYGRPHAPCVHSRSCGCSGDCP